MIVWVGECGKYYWSRKIYWFLILNILKQVKGSRSLLTSCSPLYVLSFSDKHVYKSVKIYTNSDFILA